ncbi:MAG: SDR family NAD(P)-dependent oxidoreductase [Rhodobacter sp.]|nr:SDR family NAD(P)-dependent oxidoreductase [Rhodobacter sp.]
MRVLITGATRGIGRALRDAYAEAGEDVIGTCRGAKPGAGRWVRLGVADPAAQAAMAADLAGEAIDLLVCNAGVYLDKGQSLETGYPAQMWADTFATNVAGVFLSVQSLLPNLRAARAAKIAIISSTMASQENAPGGSYIYRASKAAVLNVGRNLARDLQPDGIAVGIYHPGWVQTDMGGAGASITVDESRDGLMARFADLSIAKSGVFENWDGRPHPF